MRRFGLGSKRPPPKRRYRQLKFRRDPSLVVQAYGSQAGSSASAHHIAKRYRMSVRAFNPSPELKHVDNALSSLDIHDATNIQVLNLISQGAESDEMLGRMIYMKDLHFRGTLHPEAPFNYRQDRVRLILFVDYENHQALTSEIDILAEADAESLINFDKAKRFRILYDRTFSFDYTNSATNECFGKGPGSVTIDIGVPINRRAQYAGGDGNVADIQKGLVGMYCRGLNATGSSNDIVLRWTSRVTFYDN